MFLLAPPPVPVGGPGRRRRDVDREHHRLLIEHRTADLDPLKETCAVSKFNYFEKKLQGEEEKSENLKIRKPEKLKIKTKCKKIKKNFKKFFVSTRMISFERTTRLSENKN